MKTMMRIRLYRIGLRNPQMFQ